MSFTPTLTSRARLKEPRWAMPICTTCPHVSLQHTICPPHPSSEEAKLLPAAESSGAKGDVGPAQSPASSTCLQRYTPRIIQRGIHDTLRTATTGSAVRSPDYPAQISGANALRETLQTPEAWSSPSTGETLFETLRHLQSRRSKCCRRGETSQLDAEAGCPRFP